MSIYKIVRQTILYSVSFVFMVEVVVLSFWSVEHKYNCKHDGVSMVHELDYDVDLVYSCKDKKEEEEEEITAKPLS